MEGLSFLVVDEQAFVRDLITKVLTGHFQGCHVDGSDNGQQARLVIQQGAYSMVICDWSAPELSGLELLKWIRSDSANKALPFIMISSNGDKEYVVQAAKMGANDYIGKPFPNERLISKVEKVLASQESKSEETVEHGSLSALTGIEISKPKKAANSRPAETTNVTIQIADKALDGVLDGVSLRDVKVTLPRNDELPRLFDPVTVDFGGDNATSLNAYIYSLQAVDKRTDCDSIKATLNFTQNEPAQLEKLSKQIAKGTGKQFY